MTLRGIFFHLTMFLSALYFLFQTVCPVFADALYGSQTEPVTLYYWSSAGKYPRLHLTSKLKSSDPKALTVLSKSSWIIASADPVLLRQQGGIDDNWILIQLSVRADVKIIEETPEISSMKDCHWSASDLSSECVKAIENLVRSSNGEGLKLKSGIVILTDGKFFHPEDIRIFNHLSTDDMQDRLRIQSLFYKADFNHFKIGPSDSLFPSEINRLNPPFSGGGRGLLWDDLDGKPLSLDTH